jgi:hypothetical protein
LIDTHCSSAASQHISLDANRGQILCLSAPPNRIRNIQNKPNLSGVANLASPLVTPYLSGMTKEQAG